VLEKLFQTINSKLKEVKSLLFEKTQRNENGGRIITMESFYAFFKCFMFDEDN
jgi:hypothetical protein